MNKWKIEKEGFNTQKNGGYELSHKYSRTFFIAMQKLLPLPADYTPDQSACGAMRGSGEINSIEIYRKAYLEKHPAACFGLFSP